MASKVKFIIASTQEKYDSLGTYEPYALYFVMDKQRLYKGDTLVGTGTLASEECDGLLSAADYIKFKSLVDSENINLVPLDGSVVIEHGEIGVKISEDDGNQIETREDGLYMKAPEQIVPPEYGFVKLGTTSEGSVATYKLKRTFGNVSEYVGDAIEVPHVSQIQSGSMEIVSEENVPYVGAQIGEHYIKLQFNDANGTSIYISCKTMDDQLNDIPNMLSDIRGTINQLNEKIGEVPEGMTVVDMINNIEPYNDEELRGLISGNATVIGQILGRLGTIEDDYLKAEDKELVRSMIDQKVSTDDFDTFVKEFHSFNYEIVDELPHAGMGNMYKIYLKPVEGQEFCDKYIVIERGGEYVYEKFGGTGNVNLERYVQTNRTIAGLALDANISVEQLQTALGISLATDALAGVMKLYPAAGQNTDGTMTQKAITDEISKKFEIEADGDEEMIVFKGAF